MFTMVWNLLLMAPAIFGLAVVTFDLDNKIPIIQAQVLSGWVLFIAIILLFVYMPAMKSQNKASECQA